MKFVLLLTVTLSSGVAFADLNVSSPVPNASVSSPAHVTATASSTHPITGITVYLDGNAVFKSQNQSGLDTWVSMSTGWHTLIINAWDSTDALFQKTMRIDATSTSSPSPTPVPQGWAATKIEDMSGWNWCSKLLNGGVCAAGEGEAVSWVAQHQTSPSLDGSSAQFFLGGSTPYSNALWWKTLGATNQFSHFQYDLWVYVSNPALPETLEFDVNQSFGGHRWIFGTQCDFKDSGRWDLWDSKSGKWQPSAVPCHPFAANAWTHIVWNFERVGTQVHYISLQLNGVTIPVNVYWNYQANYGGQNTNIQFQMDGDNRQDPYHVWLNKVSLNAW